MYHNRRHVTQRTDRTPKAIAVTAGMAKSRFALLWLVVAMLFQGLVTQAHVHISTDPSSVVIASTSTLAPAVDARKNGPVIPVCLLCEEKALFGAYLLGGSVTIAAPLVVVHNYVIASLPFLAIRFSSHAWQSRAPPLFTL